MLSELAERVPSARPPTTAGLARDQTHNLLAEARVLAGAATMKDAFGAALQQVIDIELRRRHLRRLEVGEGTDLADAEAMQGAWR